MAEPSERGFSLVELLVALGVMGLLASVVILSLPGEESALRGESGRLAARIAAVRDAAIVTAQPTAVWVSPTGYGFEERRGGGWRPASDQAFAPHNWPSGTTARVGDRQVPVRIMFDTMGTTAAPVEIRLTAAESVAVVRVAASGEVQADE